MGWMMCMGRCYTCGALFAFNPERVTSIVVQGERQPVCLACITRANPERVAAGLPPIDIMPGAYDPEQVP